MSSLVCCLASFTLACPGFTVGYPGISGLSAEDDAPQPAVSVTPPASVTSLYEFHHDNVVGTQLELRVRSQNEQSACAAEQRVLQEIDRLTHVLSSYQEDSELSQWLSSGTATHVSQDLAELLQASDHWQHATDGAFHPGVEEYSRRWRIAERSAVLPPTEVLAAVSKQLAQRPWTWNDNGTVQPSGYAVTFNAIAKGLILDKACAKALQDSQVDFISINIGGDVRVAGQRFQNVVVRTESKSGNDLVLDSVRLRNQAIATSGPQFRGFTIDGQHFSHLIDPSTGMPVHHIRSASIVADSATQADALATACSVLSIEKSLALIESLPNTACLLLADDGTRHFSTRWKNLQVSSNSGDYLVTSTIEGNSPEGNSPATDEKATAKTDREKTEPWNEGMELQIDFEIIQAGSGGRYRRPYVACWVEDAKGFPVRTVVLWVQPNGDRWVPDLRRWYKSDRLRGLAEDTSLVETISEATRKPGKYSIVWDGTDDHGKLTPPGKYTFYLEAAREHGTYQLIKKEITIGTKDFEENFEDNAEMKNAHIEYRKVK